jgi:hypothetical protein
MLIQGGKEAISGPLSPLCHKRLNEMTKFVELFNPFIKDMVKFKKGDFVINKNTTTPIMKVISVKRGKIKCQWKVTDEFDLETLILKIKAVKIKPFQNINVIEEGDIVLNTSSEYKDMPMYVSNIQNDKVTCEFLQTEIFDDYLLQYSPPLSQHILIK